MPLSQCNNIVIWNIHHMNCQNFFAVAKSDKYALKDFTFENIDVADEAKAFDKDLIEGTVARNIIINGEKVVGK